MLIRTINSVEESLAYRYKSNIMDQEAQFLGNEMIIESIIALNSLFVDYGEAFV